MPSAYNPFADPTQAAAYDGWFETPLGRLIGRLQGALVERLAQPRPGERALDVGTGTGLYAVRLASQGLRVVGCDPSSAMLDVAARKGAAVQWCQAEAEHLPFGDGAFDLVLSVTVLEFVADPLRALQEMYRVTAPGGRLVVAVLNAESAWGRFYRAQAEQVETPFRYARLFTPLQFTGLLRTANAHKPPRWSSSIFFGPSGRMAWAGALLERLGQGFWPERGALLVGRVEK
ncbi:MAG: methyltransferase domain-containing protein [Chloroflexi bacterium]|nr:methyltransferase domain-containing protein [Chloroflexota bacterium]